MNILMLTSPAPASSGFSTREKRPPLGVGQLIAILEARGHSVFFDDQYQKPWPIFDNAVFLRKNAIDVVGIYSNTVCFQGTLGLVRKLQYLRKNGLWGGRIAVGGPHTSYGAEDFPEYVDHICIGEGDISFYEMVEGSEKNRIVVGKKVQNLDELPMPAWRHFIYRGYSWESTWNEGYPVYTMNTSRGCPFACTFCSVKGVWGRTYRFMSAARVIEDIQAMRKYYGMGVAYFREDHFTLNPGRIIEFCEGMLRRDIRIPWVCESRADSVVSRGMLELMHRAGCRALYIGVESGSQRMLDALKKHETVEQFEYVIRTAKHLGIKIYASMIYGVPGEMPEDLAETDAFLRRTQPDYIGRNVFAALPGSDLFETVKADKAYDYEDENGVLYPRGYERRVETFYAGSDAFRVVSRALGTPSPEIPNLVTRRAATPLVSVIMPARNAEAFVCDAARSILEQTLADYELIVVDDASEDATWDALQSIRDPRVFLHRNETRMGVTRTLNKLLSLARGEYIARMDADDISFAHRLEAQVAWMRRHPDLWACGGWHTVFDESEYERHVVVSHDEIKAYMLFSNQLPHPFMMFRGDVWRQYDLTYDDSVVYAQDYALWIRLVTRFPQARLGNVPVLVGRYRQHAAAVSQRNAAEQRRYAARAQIPLFEQLGFSRTCKDIALHAVIYQKRAAETREELVRVLGWMQKLKDANEEKNVFNKGIFAKCLLEKAVTLAGDNARYAAAVTDFLKAWK